ncbi:hypothetical protein BDZ97DRAFT_1658706 [Flammula alnicola]|nr:hypothetical protein BDZ97DRAFT_1658706 [Flammula alnicola]
MSTRAIVIDDTDPGIVYDGEWIADKGSKDNNGNYGPPYLSTMHYIKGTGSFSYSFHGTYVGIFGATVDKTNPSRECYIDGTKIASSVLSAAENGVMHCQQDGLTDGPHVITLNVTVANPTFYWFDDLMYVPSASVPLDNAAVFIKIGDPAMQFGVGWAPFSVGYATRQQNSIYGLDFFGESLTWFGFYNSSVPFAATTGTYSIDSGNPISFNLNGVASQNTGAQLNQIFFSTGQLPNKQHSLQVVYQGDNNTTPLSIYCVIIQNGTGPVLAASNGASSVPSGSTSVGASSTSSGANSTTTPNPSSLPTHHSNHTGIIVGCVIGALALALLIFAFLFVR